MKKNRKMSRNAWPMDHLVFVFLVILFGIIMSEVPRPRGVSLSRAPLYETDKDFTCFDGSKTIPFTQINDDYCDCEDGSDEPGTSACSRGTFYCTNAGYRPFILPSSRVNDGICDCCDGTDEYSSKVSCPNNCLELGEEAREEAQKMAELVKAGKQIRAEMSRQGAQMKEEKKNKLAELQKNKDEAAQIREEMVTLKNEAEKLEQAALEFYRKLEEEEKKKKAAREDEKNRAEAMETFDKFDSNRNGLLEISELASSQIFDKDRNGEVSEEEAKYFLNNEESVDLETFLLKCWSNVKPFIAMNANLHKQQKDETPTEADDMQPHTQEEEEESDEEEELPPEDDDEEEEEQHEPEQPQQEEEEEQSQNIQYDPETQDLVNKATEARNKYAEADKNWRDIENEAKQILDYLKKDFGVEEEFATLQGQCFEYEDHEYVYKLCPFDRTVQQPKSGAETKLGGWGRWSGPAENVYSAMLYEHGTACWNGPQRTTTVRVSCGEENKVVSVSEPNRCEYFFDFRTPAACRDPETQYGEEVHDEL